MGVLFSVPGGDGEVCVAGRHVPLVDVSVVGFVEVFGCNGAYAAAASEYAVSSKRSVDSGPM